MSFKYKLLKGLFRLSGFKQKSFAGGAETIIATVEYRISKCMYVEMFECYGIRSLCKIFCNTDTRSYAGLTRHVRFVRHSDLSDGPCCWDEVHRKRVR